MICPLFNRVKLPYTETFEYIVGDCLKEECAWWVKASESCAMEAIPRVIGYVGSTLKELGEKMPQDERTRPRP